MQKRIIVYRREEVGIERQNNVGAFNLVLRPDDLAKCQLRSSARIVMVHRLPHMPLRFREGPQHSLHLAREGGRGKIAGEKTQARALLCLLRIQRSLERSLEATPGPHLAEFDDGL